MRNYIMERHLQHEFTIFFRNYPKLGELFDLSKAHYITNFIQKSLIIFLFDPKKIDLKLLNILIILKYIERYSKGNQLYPSLIRAIQKKL